MRDSDDFLLRFGESSTERALGVSNDQNVGGDLEVVVHSDCVDLIFSFFSPIGHQTNVVGLRLSVN